MPLLLDPSIEGLLFFITVAHKSACMGPVVRGLRLKDSIHCGERRESVVQREREDE